MTRTLLLMFTFLSCLTAAGQTEEATTKSGKKVILYPDGRWKYADEVADKSTEPAKDKKPVVQTTTDAATDCDGRLETTEDSRSGLRITKTKGIMFAAESGSSDQIGIAIQKNSKGIITLYLYPVGAGTCIGEGNKVNIEFTDGSKAELGHDAFANCTGELSTSFGGSFGKKKQLELLKTKKIKKIKVWTQEGSVQQNISAEIQDNLQKLFGCLGG